MYDNGSLHSTVHDQPCPPPFLLISITQFHAFPVRSSTFVCLFFSFFLFSSLWQILEEPEPLIRLKSLGAFSCAFICCFTNEMQIFLASSYALFSTVLLFYIVLLRWFIAILAPFTFIVACSRSVDFQVCPADGASVLCASSILQYCTDQTRADPTISIVCSWL